MKNISQPSILFFLTKDFNIIYVFVQIFLIYFYKLFANQLNQINLIIYLYFIFLFYFPTVQLKTVKTKQNRTEPPHKHNNPKTPPTPTLPTRRLLLLHHLRFYLTLLFSLLLILQVSSIFSTSFDYGTIVLLIH